MSEQNTITSQCLRCGRKLKSPKAIALGFGRCCYKKVMADKAFAEAARALQEKGHAAAGEDSHHE